MKSTQDMLNFGIYLWLCLYIEQMKIHFTIQLTARHGIEE